MNIETQEKHEIQKQIVAVMQHRHRSIGEESIPDLMGKFEPLGLSSLQDILQYVGRPGPASADDAISYIEYHMWKMRLSDESTGVRPIDKLKWHFKNALKYEPVGATKEDIEQLERQLDVTLPRDYREFLLFMGRDHAGILRGSDCFVGHIVENNVVALPYLLQEYNLSDQIPERYICPYSHQGCEVAWFEWPTEQDDPTIYVFSESKPELGIHRSELGIPHAGSLVGFFLEFIVAFTPSFQKLRGIRG